MTAPLEPIHVAFSAEETPMAMPFAPIAFVFAGVTVLASFVLVALFRLVGIPLSALAVLFAMIGLAAAVYFIRRVWRRNVSGWKPARDGTRSDPTFRLRVVGEGAHTAPLVCDLPDHPFEPFIAFSWFAIAFVAEGIGPDNKRPDGTPVAKGVPVAVADLTRPQRWLIGVLTALFIAGIFTAQWLLLHTRQPFGPVQVMGGLGLASAAVALITPTYIRIAPGSLDILRFGWRPGGLPAYEHWDLTTSRVLIDQRLGVIRIWSVEPGPRRALLLRAAQIACRKQTLLRTLLAAARTRHPTPPLPTDALVG